MKVGSTLSEDAYKFDGKLSLKQAIPLGLNTLWRCLSVILHRFLS